MLGGDAVGDLTENKVYVYDSLLRDGCQGEGISFTVTDKIKIVLKLDEFGIDYIEAGNPGSNPKDKEFFEKINKIKLKHSKIVAFGNTRKPNKTVDEDNTVVSLANAGTSAVAVFGKSWDFHVKKIIKTSLEENLNMIRDTLSYMKQFGKEVIFDAEHFFDGYKNNPVYALKTLKAACDAGCDWIVLCDTNGATMPYEVGNIINDVREKINVPIGVHFHNDCGMAVADTIMAVKHGAKQVQGCMNGYGERCGNANLSTVVPNLQLKMNMECIDQHNIQSLVEVSRYISEITNLSHNESFPYVGKNAFTHKGGMHIDAVMKDTKSYEHIAPETVGNKRTFVMSEVSGRSTILKRIQKVAPWVTKESGETKQLMDRIKELEHDGYQFEGAESSFELMVIKALGDYKEFFEVRDFKVICDNDWGSEKSASSIIKIAVDGVEELTAAEGDGPVNALDSALRKALEVFYPEMKKMRLIDYKVRVLDTNKATGAKVRVHMESSDGVNTWGTVGLSENIIEASWIALTDSIEYFLYTNKKRN